MSDSIKKPNTLIANSILVLISIVVTLIFAEIALRFTPYKNIKRPTDFHKFMSKDYHIYTPESFYDIAKNFKDGVHDTYEFKYPIFSNKYSCFDHDRKVPDDYTLAIGDSFTWGFTPLDKKWTTYLEEKSGLFILKCGVSGYGTRQELVKAKRVVKAVGKSPKYLVLMYYENDMQDDFSFMHDGKVTNVNMFTGEVEYIEDQKEEKSEEDSKEKTTVEKTETNSQTTAQNESKDNDANQQKFRSELRYKSILYNVYMVKVKPQIKEFKKSLKRWILYGDKMPNTVEKYGEIRMINYLHQRDELKWYGDLINYHRQSLNNFVDYAKDINTTLIVIDIHGSLDNDTFKDIFDDHNDVYYYNLKKHYPKQSKWTYDLHWDVKGNQEVGEHIYQYFKKIGIAN